MRKFAIFLVALSTSSLAGCGGGVTIQDGAVDIPEEVTVGGMTVETPQEVTVGDVTVESEDGDITVR